MMKRRVSIEEEGWSLYRRGKRKSLLTRKERVPMDEEAGSVNRRA